jgi:urocanate reductase
MSNSTKHPRRDFLKMTGLAAVAAAGASSDARAAAPAGHPFSGPLPRKWDASYDLVIVGGGGTGLCAAAEAVQRKVKLLVMEKRLFIGGVSAMATGNLYGANTAMQKEAGFTDATLDAWWKMIQQGTALSEPIKRVRDNSLSSPVYYGLAMRDERLMKTITWEYATLIEFLQKYGAKFIPLAKERPFTHSVVRGYLPIVFHNMANDIRRQGGTIVTRTRANRVYLDESGKVVGIRASGPGGEAVNIRTKAILMASGGFIDNDTLTKRYLPYWMNQGYVEKGFLFADGGALPQQTGDGIVMGLEVDASLDNMDAGFKYKMAPKNRGDALVNGLSLARSPILFVNQDGNRFYDDSTDYSELMMAMVRTGGKYGYFVFDQPALSTPGATTFEFADLIEKGVIFKGDTLREAATKAGVNPDNLQATVDKFNKDFDEKGVDTAFGKKGPLFQKVAQPPFYVSDKHYPVRFKTEGGLETDEKTRVLAHRTFKPIPGLYAAGATNGTCTARLGDSMQCGRLSGRFIAEDLQARRI